MIKSLSDRIRSAYQRNETWFNLGIVLVLGILAYTPFMNKFGFYRDDWYMLWVGRTFGPQAIIDLFAFDRPLVGHLYSAVYQLLGEYPLNWQIYSFVIRIVGALGFLWILRRLWPGYRFETTTATILMLIYPGFLQWANANTKSNHLTTYTLAILSICLTVAALQASKKNRKVLYTLGALVLGISYWFLYEYMIGMEGLRLAVIALLVWRKEGKTWGANFKKIVIEWLPYLIPIVLHLAWRFFVFESGREGMNVQAALSAYQSGPFKTIVKRALVLAIDVFEALFSAWVVPINTITFQLEATDLLIGGMLSLFGMAIYLIYANTDSNSTSAASSISNGPRYHLEFTLIGAVTMLCTLIPVVVVGRDIRWVSGYDKYALHVSGGVAILIVGALSLLIRSKKKFVVFALLIGIALATQFGNSVQWAEFWKDQRELWWQLSWRAPQLKNGTVLLVEPPGQRFYEDYEIWGPANLVYEPAGDHPHIFAEVFTNDTLEKIRVGTTEIRGLRDFLEFTRNYQNSLIISRPERISCWHILDGKDPVLPQKTTPMVYATIRLSKIDQIIVNTPPSVPANHLFGSEPDHDWCYYYQIASLEAQRQNWGEVARLADQALGAGYKPIDRSEWMPFLKGLIMVGRNEDAEDMALWIRDIPTIRHRQCDYLSDSALPDPDRQTFMREILCN